MPSEQRNFYGADICVVSYEGEILRTALYCGAWLQGVDHRGDSYFDRYRKWYDYHLAIREELGFDTFYLLENGSDAKVLQKFGMGLYIPPNSQRWGIYANNLRGERLAHLPRGTKSNEYPYGWRSIFHLKKMLDEENEYDKIIILDSDGFILTKKLAHWIRSLTSGWTALWCPAHSFAEANISVLCRDGGYDALQRFIDRAEGDWNYYMGRVMEQTLPFTHIEKGFAADRFGEFASEQKPEMDFYGQARNATRFVFEMGAK